MYMILVVALCLFTAISNAFSFESSAATECDVFAVSWSGGIPPFFLHLLPAFGTSRNISIPSTAFTNGKGTFQIDQFPLPQGQEYLLAMSDASGFATGGTTGVLTVGSSRGGTCNVEGPTVDFVYQLNSALTQCRPYVFSGYSNAVQPVTIMGFIPSGTSFILRPPQGSPEFSWTANVERGTSILFMMVDAQGRQGGVSDIKLVGSSDDRSCLNGRSPSSTSALPTSTAPNTQGTTNRPTTTSTESAPGATTSDAASSSGGTSIAAIAGTVIGALVFLAVVVTLGLFFLRKRKDQQRPLSYRGNRPMDSDLQYEAFGGNNKHHPYALSTGAANAFPTSPSSHLPYKDYNNQPYRPDYQPSTYAQSTYTANPNAHNASLSGNAYDGYNDGSMLPYDSNPFLDSQQQTYPPGANYPYQSSYALPSASAFMLPNTAEMFNAPPHDRGQPLPPLPPPPSPPAEDPFGENTSTSDSITSARHRKAAMAGLHTYKPSTIMQHTDADDILPPPNEDGVVELPPQYTERRVLGLAVVNQSPPSPSPTSQQFPPTQHYPPPPS